MVMRKTLRIFALLIAASMLLWIAGCGGDDDDDDCGDNVDPVVTLSPAGGAVASNAVITANVSKPVDSLTVSGGIVAAGAGKVWTFSLPEGAQSVTVDATDSCDGAGSASGSYTVTAPDTDAPEIDGGGSDPKDGADGVDPADVSEIVIKFTEDLKAAELTAFEPDVDVDAEVDGDTVVISFLGGATLSNEQEIVAELDVEDLAGNTASVEYTFTTMAKE
jgi:uncharacterized protein (DUF697 family)